MTRQLLVAAKKLIDKGYSVGFAKGKTFAFKYEGFIRGDEKDFDGVSIIPEEGVVCVDFDEPDFGLIDEPLPPTWKERTRRGWHLFYLIPHGAGAYNRGSAKIGWRKHVDLLIKTASDENKVVAYGRGGQDNDPWTRHVLVSPTEGYRMVWPEELPEKDKLTKAPDWLIDAVLK